MKIYFSDIRLCKPVSKCTGKDQLVPVNFSKVTITDNFWKPKLMKWPQPRSMPVFIKPKCHSRIRNFEKVARKKGKT
jgi:hypothetical protein